MEAEAEDEGRSGCGWWRWWWWSGCDGAREAEREVERWEMEAAGAVGQKMDCGWPEVGAKAAEPKELGADEERPRAWIELDASDMDEESGRSAPFGATIELSEARGECCTCDMCGG